MKAKLVCVLLTLSLLCGCSGGTRAASSAPAQEGVTILATTYPVYLAACAAADGVSGVRVERLNTGEVSCLHDYTLSVNDMKKIEQADVIAMSGVGLEDFMEDALAASQAGVIRCDEGVQLLENLSHHHDEHDHSHDGHDHGHFDPHYWMDPENMAVMVENMVRGLCQADPDNADTYISNGERAAAMLTELDGEVQAVLEQGAEQGVEFPGLITFHDGFQYFAHAYELPLLESIEEEAGSEASAHEIMEITALVKDHNIPVIFTETNGSDATAQAIARETGCRVAQLSMCMDGEENTLGGYREVLLGNMTAVVNGFAGEESVK